MPNLNKVLLIGHLGKDPEFKSLPSGKTVCTASLATTERWGKGDDKKEKTEWHNLVAWGQPGEFMAQFATKGTCLLVEGKLQTRAWEDKEGNKRYTTEINVTHVQIVSGGAGAKGKDKKGPEPADDDIPF